MNHYVINDPEVVQFVAKANGIAGAAVHSSIGLKRDGKIVAGIIYDNFTRTNICMHVASEPGSNWLTRAFLKLVFGWPFNALKVKRITAMVPENNAPARKFDEHLGFKFEAKLPDVYPDGGLLILRMYREECRFV